MKKSIFIGFVLSMMCLCSFSQENDSTEAKKSSIEFNELIHDFGQITRGGDGTFEFEFKVEGDSPVVLSNVRSSCGCTVPSWSREPILPSKTGKISVRYDTNRVGPFTKTITVYSDATNSPVVLRIKGTVSQ